MACLAHLLKQFLSCIHAFVLPLVFYRMCGHLQGSILYAFSLLLWTGKNRVFFLLMGACLAQKGSQCVVAPNLEKCWRLTKARLGRTHRF